jgi:hypothetical protein
VRLARDTKSAEGGHRHVAGWAGDVGLETDGDIVMKITFMVRTLGLWTDRSYAVLSPDTIEGDDLRGLHSSAQYAQVVHSLLGYAPAQLLPRLCLFWERVKDRSRQ